MINLGKSLKKIVSRAKGPRQCVPEYTQYEHITLLLFSSAKAGWLKPLCILPLKNLPPLTQDVLDSFQFSGQENGWIDGPIFKNIIETYFVEEIRKLRIKLEKEDEPALLIFDHHSSRDALNEKLLWEAHKIICLVIPAHSSAVTQPLDLAINGEFKHHLKERFQSVKEEDSQERRNRLLQIVDLVLSRVTNKDTALTGWRRTGLWPFNPEAPLKSNTLRDDLPSLEQKRAGKRRKSGPCIYGGRIMYDGKVVNSLPAQVEIEEEKIEPSI
jgi:hypothetical protein